MGETKSAIERPAMNKHRKTEDFSDKTQKRGNDLVTQPWANKYTNFFFLIL